MPTDGKDKQKFRYPTPDDMTNDALLRTMDLYEREIRKTILQQMLAPPILARGLNDPEPPVKRVRSSWAYDDSVRFWDPSIPRPARVPATGIVPAPDPFTMTTRVFINPIFDPNPSPYIPSPIIPPWIDPPDQDPYPDLRPRMPVQYDQSSRARSRSAVFTGQAGACLRCGRRLEGQQVVNVAPPGLPRATVHTGCLETDDQIEEKPDGSA